MFVRRSTPPRDQGPGDTAGAVAMLERMTQPEEVRDVL